jgi:hypothetical protein
MALYTVIQGSKTILQKVVRNIIITEIYMKLIQMQCNFRVTIYCCHHYYYCNSLVRATCWMKVVTEKLSDIDSNIVNKNEQQKIPRFIDMKYADMNFMSSFCDSNSLAAPCKYQQ